ncbi:MAG: hypothetical protein ACFFCX_09860 [Candidatus Sifarchaeia archaeon]
MKRTRIVIIPFLCIMLVWVPISTPISENPSTQFLIQTTHSEAKPASLSQTLDAKTGILDPVLIQHFGAASGVQLYSIGRTDTDPTPSSEVFCPVGPQGNYRSADCSGGYFVVGTGGSADFGSPQGTISLWIKWDGTAPHGRFWGQHADFETRWSTNRLTLDWGGDTSITGIKNDWVANKWYFLAITWNAVSGHLALYWGDENTEPQEDNSISTWTGSLSNHLTENNIMKSGSRTTDRVDGHVDDFRYYVVERSFEEVRSDYDVTLSGTEANLSSYYQFEGLLSDSSGDQNLEVVGSSSFSYDVYSGNDPWRAEQIEMNIRNLERLYVLQGLFETGNPGTNVDWNGDGVYYAEGWRARREVLNYNGRQRTSYIDTGVEYITIENEGYPVSSPDGFRHYDGTSIYWFQIVNNNQLEDEFEFSMDYLYERGPIGTNFSNIFEFSFEVLNGTSVIWNWSIDPTNITQRNNWYSTGAIVVDIPGAPSQFEVRISLKIDSPSSYIQILETDGDLDGNPDNGQFVTFFIDGVTLRSLNSPNLEDVDFSVSLSPIGTTPIFGESGQGTILLNYSYWESSSIPFTFSSNTSVSFEFQAKINRMSRFLNSTYSRNLENEGVAYSIELGANAEYLLHTYLRPSPEATDIGFIVHYPSDWSSPQVEDDGGQNFTDQVIVESEQLVIPPGLAVLVGWWKIIFSGPNYASELITQVRDTYDITWIDEFRYYSGDRIRCIANIGTESHSVENVSNVEVVWYLPSGSIWSTETINSENSSVVASSAATLGPINATVGEWLVSVSWSNGSEVGYGFSTFELYHQFTVFAHSPNQDIEVGDEIRVGIYLYDQDNGNPILSEADVRGNWSTSTVSFSPNLAKSWWEAYFNSTNLVPGTHVIIIEVSMPYYEDSSTSVYIQVPDVESLYAITFRATLLGALLVGFAFAAIVISRRFYMSIVAKRNVELIGLEGRIDDAKNLIGLLVIHRSVGLPIYSKIIKGGFQESILSSFIAAISQFRSEFSMDEPIWTAIPITEAIMAVQTEALICAIITVETASYRQRTQLESFGKEVGEHFDKDDVTMRKMVRTPSLNGEFESIFERHFDGQLMKRYVGIKKNLPKHLSIVSDALQTMEIDHGVSVEALIKSVSVLGYSERRAHKLVLETVDSGYLIAADTKLPPPIPEEE